MMPECTKGEREVLDALREAGAFHDAPGPYPETPRKAGIKRFRLFTPDERRTILKALPNSAAGLLDEMEMINYDVGGLWPERNKR